MLFFRKAILTLQNWKAKAIHKPLLIRGARQVGKSTLVGQFSDQFTHFISTNLEKKEYKALFESLDNVKDIFESLLIMHNIPWDGEPTLLFLDEIQECPKAIQFLRYFFEELPHIHVVAAGSLLEFAIKDVPSFPVGRTEQFVLHPMDFEEFLNAIKNKPAIDHINKIPFSNGVFQPILDLFHKYLVIGGMPEVIKNYVENGQINHLPDIYESLLQGYRDDVEKYAKNNSEKQVIRHIMETAHAEKDRISFEGFGNSKFRSREVGEALRTLDMSRVIQLIYPSTNLNPPVIDDVKKRPRLQFLDVGLLNYQSNRQLSMLQVKDFNEFHQGKVIMQMVTQEIKAQYHRPSYRPNFWVRDKAGTSAEIDLVYPFQQYLLPIEIKSGPKGKLRSLFQYMDMVDHHYAIRLLANRFSVEKVKTLSGKSFYLFNLPYFLAGKIPQYAEWFVFNYPMEQR